MRRFIFKSLNFEMLLKAKSARYKIEFEHSKVPQDKKIVTTIGLKATKEKTME